MEDGPGTDLWGLRAPTAPPQRRPPRTLEETRRLVRVLEEEAGVAGRFRCTEIGELKPGWSGATMVYGTWDGPAPLGHEGRAQTGETGATGGDGSFPVIVKLGAGEREVNW